MILDYIEFNSHTILIISKLLGQWYTCTSIAQIFIEIDSHCGCRTNIAKYSAIKSPIYDLSLKEKPLEPCSMLSDSFVEQ